MNKKSNSKKQMKNINYHKKQKSIEKKDSE